MCASASSPLCNCWTSLTKAAPRTFPRSMKMYDVFWQTYRVPMTIPDVTRWNVLRGAGEAVRVSGISAHCLAVLVVVLLAVRRSISSKIS